ncbi:MAG: excinuclease ABC subunit B [Flavobacteriaceae bacterium]|nr:excinuclease ABC subunit B [Flavobacteriaceae bacterium]OUV84888.1 MAG: excinuclease ABC subunit B [Flavobacteriaceae bacterium TMED145]|tara:strand:+ start:2015 stop:4012 length:1998 start_codon:yes stop_codon:yes gene_type:complete
MNFKLKTDFTPTGDQPNAIQSLIKGIKSNEKHQTLLGVTGSGKTFTVANVILELNKPTLVLAHNKTLAAQLYSEFKGFFPENLVEYFVSYYDYYQPEAYIPTTGVYIEKDLSINEEIEKLRLSATSALLSGRNDILIVASVSCIYGMGNPQEFKENTIEISENSNLSRTQLLNRLVQSLYSRSISDEFKQGKFRIIGDTIDIFPAHTDFAFKIHFFGDEIEEIEKFDPFTNKIISKEKSILIYPANIFVTSPNKIHDVIKLIQDDLLKQYEYFNEIGSTLEANRIKERTEFDMEMIKELGYCSGIENYSRYFDGRKPGTRPFCLLDYFPNDYLTIIDESHVTIPQVRAMYGGDRSRKENLVEYGFRLPAAMDNRPLKFEEFELLQNEVIYVSATPADYELEMSEGIITEQIIRPTGLLDPLIEIKPTKHQIDDLIDEIQKRVDKKEKILVTTLTKKMAEELSSFLSKIEVRSKYIHSDVDTIERVEIMQGLREDKFDVLIGVNLLREGLDLPEVSLVAILDADKEGFLRSHRSLTQTIGRAARHVNGIAILYADKITNSIKKTIDETNYRRAKQIEYNKKNGVVPKPIVKSIDNPLTKRLLRNDNEEISETVIDFKIPHKSKDFDKKIRELQREMEKSAKELDFNSAALYRDQIKKLKEIKSSSF